jgi:DNA polymerase III subunit beta
MFTFSLDKKTRIQNICSHASSKINPIFEQVLVEAKANQVRFSASNGSQFNTIVINAQVEEPVSLALSAKRLNAVLSALAADTAKFTVKDNSVIIKSGKSRLKSPIFPASEYPDAPRVSSPESTIKCTVAQLAALFNTASYAVAKNDVRAYLCHVNLTIEDQTVRVCATDGHRLSQLIHDDLECEGQGSYLVPTSLISSILSQSIEPESPVTISFNAGQASIVSADVSVVSVLGEGRYPDINQVIPTSRQNSVTFNLNELRGAVKRFHAVASLEKAPVLKFTITNEVELSVSSTDEANCFSESISAEVSHTNGDTIVIGVNPSYIADALVKQSGEKVTFYFNTNSAILITCDINELITLVMPVRVH